MAAWIVLVLVVVLVLDWCGVWHTRKMDAHGDWSGTFRLFGCLLDQ
jgi:hypothetical protein